MFGLVDANVSDFFKRYISDQRPFTQILQANSWSRLVALHITYFSIFVS